MEEICKFVAARPDEIRQLTRRADEETIKRGMNGPPLQLGVAYELKPLPEPVELLVGEVTKLKNSRSGREMLAMIEDKATPVKMLDYGMFAATRSVPVARAYLFRRQESLRPVLEKLLAHGIAVEELTAPLTTEVESFVIESMKKADRPFQKHNEVKLAGRFKSETVTFPIGSVMVQTAQPLGLLVACLLEPESDDGLVTWNFLDADLEIGKVYPIHRLMKDPGLGARVLSGEKAVQ